MNQHMGERIIDQNSRATGAPWVEVLTLGEARFGILVGGPFDGRCYPLPERTPLFLDVPGPEGKGQPKAIRYVLHEGYYRFAGVAGERPAA